MMLHAGKDTTYTRRKCRRERSNSSLDGFIAEHVELPTVDENFCIVTQQKNKEELRMLSHKLHQVKRRLLLKSVEKPTNSVDQFRQLLLQISMKENNNDVVEKQAAQLWLKSQAKVSLSKPKNEVPPVTKLLPLKATENSSGSSANVKPCPKVVSSSVENENCPVLNACTMERNKVVASTA